MGLPQPGHRLVAAGAVCASRSLRRGNSASTFTSPIDVAGETKHHVYGPGEYKVHDLENIGPAELIFTTVEFLDSANPPLALVP